MRNVLEVCTGCCQDLFSLNLLDDELLLAIKGSPQVYIYVPARGVFTLTDQDYFEEFRKASLSKTISFSSERFVVAPLYNNEGLIIAYIALSTKLIPRIYHIVLIDVLTIYIYLRN